MIHEEICTYEVCKLAKEKGFNEYVEAFYAEGCDTAHSQGPEKWNEYKGRYAAPTQSLLQRWLRDNGFGEVEVRHWPETNKYPHHYGWEVKDNLGNLMGYSSKMFDTYELALEDALAYSLKNLV